VILAFIAVYGLPFAERLVPALPHLREIAVLSVLGVAGAVAYGGTLIAVLAAFGIRLRRA
jgi:putative peptidoglycan lipid II flippase